MVVLEVVRVGWWASGPALGFPAPDKPETGLMPVDDRLRLDDHEHLRPPRPHRAEGRPEKPIGITEGWGFDRAVQHQQLVPQGEVLLDEMTTDE